MNAHEDRATDYLLHILEALTRIENYTSGVDEAQFFRSPLIQDAVIRNIGIVGEAAKRLLDVAPKFSSDHPEIPFAALYGMRNRVIHGYASVNPAIVWESVRNDVPELKEQVSEILGSIDRE